MENLQKFKDGKWLYHFLEREIKFVEGYDKEKYGKLEDQRPIHTNNNQLRHHINTNGIKNMIIDRREKKVKELEPLGMLFEMRNKKVTMTPVEPKGTRNI